MKPVAFALILKSFFVLVALLVFGQCVSLDLSGDEHQFIAPAVLWAREGLLPYRDVPLFHQPYLIALNALLVHFFASPILATRLLSGTAAFLTSLLLFACAWRATRLQTLGHRLTAGVSVVLLWLTSHLFSETSGRTWNHDLPCLLALAALALLLFSEKRTPWHWLAAGVLAGLAAGGRLTMAPFAGLLPLTALLWRDVPWRTGLAHLVCAGAGTALALAPSAWLYWQSPEAYLFGNLEFPRLPLLDADNSRILKTMQPWRKIRFFFKEVVLDHLPLTLATVGLGIAAVRRHRSSATVLPWRWIVPSLALLAGAFAPSRYEMQHFYIVAPLAALLAAFALRGATPRAIGCLLAAALISSAVGYRGFANAARVFDPEDWDVTEMQNEAAHLRSRVSRGKVLSLAPIVVLESGLSVYPPIATGRFGWKFAHLVAQPRRGRLGLMAPEDLPGILSPPIHLPPSSPATKTRNWSVPSSATPKGPATVRNPFLTISPSGSNPDSGPAPSR